MSNLAHKIFQSPIDAENWISKRGNTIFNVFKSENAKGETIVEYNEDRRTNGYYPSDQFGSLGRWGKEG